MATIAGILAALAFLAFVVVAVLASRSYSHFLARLRMQHPEVWTRIGRPSMSSDEAEADVHSESSRFLWKRQYRQIPDAELNGLGDRTRSLSFALLYLFFAVIVFGSLVAALSQ